MTEDPDFAGPREILLQKQDVPFARFEGQVKQIVKISYRDFDLRGTLTRAVH
jgi:hypothetical protein